MKDDLDDIVTRFFDAPTGKVFYGFGVAFLKMMMQKYTEQELIDFGYVGVIEYWGA